MNSEKITIKRLVETDIMLNNILSIFYRTHVAIY